MTDSNNNPISNVTINIGGKLEVTDKEGMFMTIYLEGKHKLELVHNNFQTKIMQFMVEKSRMTRRDVIMDSLAPSLSYHTMEGVHGELVDYKGETEINKTEVEMHVQSGHFWKLLPIGQHTISVGEVTRLVKVMPGKLTIVKFEVERKGMPWLVVFSIMATGLGLSFLVMSICRLVRKIIFKHLKMYFCTGDAESIFRFDLSGTCQIFHKFSSKKYVIYFSSKNYC